LRLLLDTRVLLFWSSNSPRLTARARRAIEEPANACFVSLASAWELAIKASLGKLRLAAPAGRFFASQLSAHGFDALGIELTHIAAVEALPKHHGDPFDRLLVAQALAESLVVVSPDAVLSKYGVKRIW
jgi:PIN domain nuclease of toxin-antitoxin system